MRQVRQAAYRFNFSSGVLVRVAVHRECDRGMPRQRLRDFRMGTRRRKVADERVPQRMKVSHPVSVVALSDADCAASLLAEFANRLTSNDDFTP